jgi:inner membrane protein
MDNVTHSLVGLMMSRAVATRPPRAAVMMILAANLPDIDVVSGLGGALSYIEWHRSYTHSLAFAPLMALIPLLMVWRFSVLGYAMSLAGVLSHLVLDWTNVYGIRMLLPFSHRWLRLDQTDVVDPWILAILLLAVAAPALARMVGSEIGSKKSAGPSRGWAWFALLAVLTYDGARFAAHQRALGVMGAHLFNGAIPNRLTAVPNRQNPWRWRGIAEAEGFVDIVPIDLATEFDPSGGRVDYTTAPNSAIEAARRTRPFEIFGSFNQLPFWKVTPVVDGTLVELIDLRFGTPENPGFEARAVVDASGEAHEAKFTFGNPLPTGKP